MGTEASIAISTLEVERLDEIVGLVLRCDETWRAWAPAGWEPPSADRERASWRLRLQGGDHWARGVLGEGGELVGVVAWRPARTRGREGAIVPGTAHLGMLFVDPGAWGGGIGAALLVAAEDAMREARYSRAILNVAERNPARAFYEHHGWRAEGPPVYSPGLDLPLVPYAKDL